MLISPRQREYNKKYYLRNKKRLIISIWGIQNRTPEINKLRWDKYYLKNKESYKDKRRVDRSHKVSNALRRIEHKREVSIKKQLKDITILKNEINNYKRRLNND